jgi:predicted Zn-dependent protease
VTDLFSPSARCFRRSPLGFALLLVALALPFTGLAQEQKDNKTLSDKVSEGLTKIKPLTDENHWDEALAILDGLQKEAAPGGSYDEALLANIRANIYLRKNEFPKAIAPMETALRLSDEHHYFDDKTSNEMAKYLTQLYYQEAVVKDRTKQQQAMYFTKASGYIKRVIDNSKDKPNPDDVILYASILYNLASMNPDKVDLALIKKAQDAVQGAMLLSIKPKTQFYDFLQVTYIQQADYAHAAEILELLVKLNPTNTTYWGQLAAMYLALGNDEKNKELALGYNIRAILTIERAQAVGQMKGPKDYNNLISIYLIIGQFDLACEMLESGLKNGNIEQDEKNWLQLAYYYQQVNKETKAIETLKAASARYPKSGQLDFQAAQIYYSLDKLEDAYRESLSAATKGIPDKNGATWQFVAYCAYELHKLPEALDAVNRAASFSDSKKDLRLPQLKKAIEDAMKDHDQEAEFLKAKQKL